MHKYTISLLVNVNEKIEELQKTVNILLTEKNALVQLNRNTYIETAADIKNLKLKLAIVERKWIFINIFCLFSTFQLNKILSAFR
jgi:hypothetical protein